MDLEVLAGGKIKIPTVMIYVEDGMGDKKIISDAWKAVDIDIDFFHTKRAKNPYEFRDGESVKASPYFIASKLSISEIGCYFSHYRVWRIALEKAWPYVLILEEDAYPTDCFRTVIRHALKIKDPDAVVMLFHEVSKESRTLHTWEDGVRLIKGTRRGGFSSMGYILFRGALQKLVASMNICQMPVDHFYDYSFLTRVNSYTLKPYAVKNSKAYYSYIEGDRIRIPSFGGIQEKDLSWKVLGVFFNRFVVRNILSQRISGRLIDKDWHPKNISEDKPRKSKLQIAVIALEPDKYRESKYMKEWMKYGIYPKIFRAVDGRKHQPLLLPGEKLSFDGIYTAAVMGEDYSSQNTEIGCYFSHLRLWKWALERGIERLLVIEEDVMPCENVREAIQNFDSLEYDIIYLLRYWYKKSIFHKQLSTGFITAQPVKDSWSTGCYMATELAMKRWVKKLSTMNMPIDNALHVSRQTCRLRAVELRPYSVIMDPVYQSAIELERERVRVERPRFRKRKREEELNHYQFYKREMKILRRSAKTAFWKYLLRLSLRLLQPGDGNE